ncbi:MAG: hypothetical protein ACR2O3_10175 [Rhizobiaceae bacterium]
MNGKRWITICLTFSLVFLAGCNKPDKFQKEFGSKFPKPEWFDEIDAPAVKNAKEATALWRSEKRCCGAPDLKKNLRIMYKSCYNAILQYYRDEELVVGCISKMTNGAPSPQPRALWKYLAETYPDHKKDITRCSNCMEGDTIARATHSLARYEYSATKNASNSIGLVEKFMDKRGTETSPWIQAETYEFLSKLYLEAGVTEDTKLRYQKIREALAASVASKSVKPWRLEKFEKVYALIMAE